MSLEAKARTSNQIIDYAYGTLSVKKALKKWVPLEEAQKEIKRVQDINLKYADLFEKREKELLAKIADVKKIVDEPDPHGEKYKQKLWRLKEILQ